MIFKIDNENFSNVVKMISLERSAHFLDKYAKRNLKGVLARELIGVYVNYKLKVEMLDNMPEYHRLWNKLTEPVPYHTVTLPYSGNDSDTRTYTYVAYLADIKDEGFKIRDGEQSTFCGLEVEFIAKAPFKSPNVIQRV